MPAKRIVFITVVSLILIAATAGLIVAFAIPHKVPTCKDGEYEKGKKCFECIPGFFCKQNKLLTCEVGFEPDVAKGAARCKECPVGSYSNSSGFCQKCEKGYFGDLPGLSDCKECPDGTFSSKEGASLCLKCPAGSDCTNKAQPLVCPKGTSSLEGTKGCQKCAKGFYQDQVEMPTCKACLANTFSAELA